MGKIEKLTKSIEKKKIEIVDYEAKIDDGRQMLKDGRIDKDHFTKARLKYQEKIRAVRTTIHRKEKARLQLEKKEKEKREEKEEKAKEEEQKRKLEAREKERQDKKDKKLKTASSPKKKV